MAVTRVHVEVVDRSAAQRWRVSHQSGTGLSVLSPRWSVAAGPRSRDTGSTVKQTAVNVSFTEGVGAMKTTSRRYKNVKGDANENCINDLNCCDSIEFLQMFLFNPLKRTIDS
mmetsp:Transcript_11542/g.21127  ORF Transcript_11542/g.21127 Transcript_11542/m.21127 type:complete len:113 (+) Transcript_11542:38-376(+)